MNLGLHTVEFGGALLQRGYWIYVWRIRYSEEFLVYIGRTGDSSSVNAASPFNRIGQHLDLREGSRSNALTKNLRAAGIDPVKCRYEFFAVGPIFPEARARAEHERLRDKVAAVEAAVARKLGRRYRVLGKHGSRKPLEPAVLQAVMVALPDKLLGADGHEQKG